MKLDGKVKVAGLEAFVAVGRGGQSARGQSVDKKEAELHFDNGGVIMIEYW